VERRDGSSCLLFVLANVPVLLLLWGLQAYGLGHADVRSQYDDQALSGAQWGLGVLIVWLGVMAYLGWQRRHQGAPMPWLVQLTVIPGVLGVTLLSLAYGLKDTPMCMVLLEVMVFARALFRLGQLRWAYAASLMAVLLSELLVSQGKLSYAPLLAQPVYMGGELSPWWAIWLRVVFTAATFPFSWALFFLATSFNRHRRELETLVRTDMLTGLVNRREFMTQLERESHRHARGGRPLSVVLFDIDHFKRVNDTWGHPVGDAVLAEVGRILRAHTRDQVDVVARYGGEEFVLLLPETDLDGARHVAEKISSRLREHAFDAQGQHFFVTQSVGIAQVVEGDTGWALRVADRNLYEAKRAGRDTIIGSVAFGDEAGAHTWP